jgi:hypothetical protein
MASDVKGESNRDDDCLYPVVFNWSSSKSIHLFIGSVLLMARKYSRKPKTTFGKIFKKKGTGGKFRKGTKVQYKYVNGRRVGTVKARK